MELKPNMYVRIQWGNGEQTISKCSNKVDIGDTQYSKNDFYIHTDKRGEVIYKSMILKASENIIDLIEVGDYVNGHRIYEVIHDVISYVVLEDVGCYVDTSKIIDEKDIKSIVTKEQFSQMEYKI